MPRHERILKPVQSIQELAAREIARMGPAGLACRAGHPLMIWEVQLGRCSQCEKVAEHDRVETASRKLEEQRYGNLEKVLAKAGVPERLRSMTRDTWKGGFPDSLKSWLRREPKRRENVLIYGPVGTGKTHLAVAALGEHLLQNDHPADEKPWQYIPRQGRFIRAGRFFMKLKQEFDSRSKRVMDQHIETPLLVLDDFGASQLSGQPWRIGTLLDLLSERFDAMRPTIVTTNMTPGQLTHTEARLADRLLSGITVERSGSSRRGMR